MTVHLQKLCVGCDSAEDLAAWIAESIARKRRAGLPAEQVHTTRMMPTRVAELLDGGSLYWVISGQIRVRQRLLDMRAVTDAAGIGRCELVLEPLLHAVDPVERRPFQGWRYLAAAESPADLSTLGASDLPISLVRELRQLGLW